VLVCKVAKQQKPPHRLGCADTKSGCCWPSQVRQGEADACRREKDRHRPGGAASLEGRGAINLLVRAQAAGAWSWHQKAARERSPHDFPILDSSRAKRSVKTETPRSTFGNNLKSVASIADSGQVPTFPSLPPVNVVAHPFCFAQASKKSGREASPGRQDPVIFENNQR
jgi:hypothetical protein